MEEWGWKLAGAVGIDPGGLTLRQLLWAADGRQESEWRRVASLAASVHHSFTGEAVDPEKLMPERYRIATVEREKTQAEIDHEGKCAWALLDAAFNPGGK